jgi:hypothetical protein
MSLFAWLARDNMDAYDIAHKIQKYWMALVPKNSGEIHKNKEIVKVLVMTNEGYREVIGVKIVDDKVELVLDNE